MRIHDPITEAEEPYNLVPLTDMVFNLLIFFMCATTFVQVEKEMTLSLPKSGLPSAMSTSTAADPLIINIKQNGHTVISGKEYSDSDALARRIEEAVASRKDQVVIIRADEEGIVKYFADVVRICTQAGVKEAKLVYLDSSAGGKGK
jgi:biopolymer transport protein ExbD